MSQYEWGQCLWSHLLLLLAPPMFLVSYSCSDKFTLEASSELRSWWTKDWWPIFIWFTSEGWFLPFVEGCEKRKRRLCNRHCGPHIWVFHRKVCRPALNYIPLTLALGSTGRWVLSYVSGHLPSYFLNCALKRHFLYISFQFFILIFSCIGIEVQIFCFHIVKFISFFLCLWLLMSKGSLFLS